jgi:hypothetical protein
MKKLIVLLCLAPCAFAQKMQVKVIGHKTPGYAYTRNLPGVALSNGNSSANCSAYGNNANCSSSGNSGTVYVPPRTVQGTLYGQNITLLLPDGRKALVHCEDHYSKMTNGLHQCKAPAVDEIEADFSGKKVKLKWPVGIDGKKSESETYEIFKVISAAQP